jgi:hypothetical protein
MLAEFVFRALTSGFYGAITQALSQAGPEWAAAMASAVLLPAVSHSIELIVHVLRGTPNIRASLISSVTFTILSTLFNLYAMRRGALIVGPEGDSVGGDLRRVPPLLAGFIASGPLALYRLIARRSAIEPAGLGNLDLLKCVPAQVPAGQVAEMRHQRVDAGLSDWRAGGVLNLVPAIEHGIVAVHLHLFQRPPAKTRPNIVGKIRKKTDAKNG